MTYFASQVCEQKANMQIHICIFPSLPATFLIRTTRCPSDSAAFDSKHAPLDLRNTFASCVFEKEADEQIHLGALTRDVLGVPTLSVRVDHHSELAHSLHRFHPEARHHVAVRNERRRARNFLLDLERPREKVTSTVKIGVHHLRLKEGCPVFAHHRLLSLCL